MLSILHLIDNKHTYTWVIRKFSQLNQMGLNSYLNTYLWFIFVLFNIFFGFVCEHVHKRVRANVFIFILFFWLAVVETWSLYLAPAVLELCRPDWSKTHMESLASACGVGIKGVCHHGPQFHLASKSNSKRHCSLIL